VIQGTATNCLRNYTISRSDLIAQLTTEEASMAQTPGDVKKPGAPAPARTIDVKQAP